MRAMRTCFAGFCRNVRLEERVNALTAGAGEIQRFATVNKAYEQS